MFVQQKSKKCKYKSFAQAADSLYKESKPGWIRTERDSRQDADINQNFSSAGFAPLRENFLIMAAFSEWKIILIDDEEDIREVLSDIFFIID